MPYFHQHNLHNLAYEISLSILCYGKFYEKLIWGMQKLLGQSHILQINSTCI